MSKPYVRTGYTEADLAKAICVLPGSDEIEKAIINITITNNTQIDAFVKIALGATTDPAQEEWIDAGHALFAVTPDSVGIRAFDALGNQIPREDYDEEGISFVMSSHASSERTSLICLPSTAIIVWCNVSEVSVRVHGLVDTVCNGI